MFRLSCHETTDHFGPDPKNGMLPSPPRWNHPRPHGPSALWHPPFHRANAHESMTRLWAFLWTITRFMFHVLVIVAHLSGERVRGCPPPFPTHTGPPHNTCLALCWVSCVSCVSCAFAGECVRARSEGGSKKIHVLVRTWTLLGSCGPNLGFPWNHPPLHIRPKSGQNQMERVCHRVVYYISSKLSRKT